MAWSRPGDEEAPHIAALRRAVDAGFVFRQLADADGVAIAALYAERRSPEGVVENLAVCGMNEAIARRLRAEDYPGGDPLWERTGTVAEVVADLLALPAHGSPGAPSLARRPSGSLWLPGMP
ncbi:hypothetical protein [Amycolatopsis aidingensis]|uniref:hypothetical protein n=1 Tax=Amycolatopsis aidingensis TaxID=2842453 RepID=UPI001C0DBE1B|nr:hypothetical protein [Amycolatopsis aidingensis]